MKNLNTIQNENDKKFIDNYIKENPKHIGWVQNPDTKDYFYIKKDHTYPSNEVYRIKNKPCAFNDYGKAIDGFVLCEKIYNADKKKSDYNIIFYMDNLENMSFNDFSNRFGLDYLYFNGHNGLIKDSVVKIKFTDFDSTVIIDKEGHPVKDRVWNGKLCNLGFIVDSTFWLTPYKKFGTIIIHDVPFLIDAEGNILNVKKCRYKDGKVFAYVNSDKTFYYSTTPIDRKWY